MKKITLLTMLVALFSGTAFAQQTTAFKCIDRTAQTAIRKAPKAVAENELVTPPASATVETWHTTDGVLYVNTASGPVEFRPDIKVAIDGSDIYLQGLAYWFPEGWVKGTKQPPPLPADNSWERTSTAPNGFVAPMTL